MPSGMHDHVPRAGALGRADPSSSRKAVVVARTCRMRSAPRSGTKSRSPLEHHLVRMRHRAVASGSEPEPSSATGVPSPIGSPRSSSRQSVRRPAGTGLVAVVQAATRMRPSGSRRDRRGCRPAASRIHQARSRASGAHGGASQASRRPSSQPGEAVHDRQRRMRAEGRDLDRLIELAQLPAVVVLGRGA